MPNFDNDKLYVNCGQRFSGAWSEINMRLQSRQTVNVFFVTAMFATLALQEKMGKNDFLPVISIVISWIFSFWVRHNDTIIGLLSLYCKTLEELDDPDNIKGIPAWHSKAQNIMGIALEARKLSDYSMMIIVICAPISLLFIGTCPLWQNFLIPISSILCALHIKCNAVIRKNILNGMEFKMNDAGKFIFTNPGVSFFSILNKDIHNVMNKMWALLK